MRDTLCSRQLVELSKGLCEGVFTSSELVNQYLERIESYDQHYHSIAFAASTAARILAEKADRNRSEQVPIGRLGGIPILVDDLLDVANFQTSYGISKFTGHVPEYDSPAVQCLKDEGAIILGKTRTSEFGIVSEQTASNSICKSPWGERLFTGSGSDGMCVAVRMNFAPAAIGLENCANVMLPAAFCGVFAISLPNRSNHREMSSSIAIVANSANDCAILLDCVNGPNSTFCTTGLNRSIKSLRIAIYPNLWNAPIDEAHKSALLQVEKLLGAIGCRLTAKRPNVRNSIEEFKTIFAADLRFEKSSIIDQTFGLLEDNTVDFIEWGRSITTKEYLQARKTVNGIRVLLNTFFEEFDLLVVPAAGCVPFKLGELPSNWNSGLNQPEWKEYASMCAIGALSGYPVAHLPTKCSQDSLPVGVLVIAQPGNEDLILATCSEIEKSYAM